MTTKNTRLSVTSLKNYTTYEFMVTCTINGKESSEANSFKTTMNVYFKPAPTAAVTEDGIKLKWQNVIGATKYRVYKYVNGKLKLVTETTKNSLTLTGTMSGKKYVIAVRAYVDGKWTKGYTGDLVSVKAK